MSRKTEFIIFAAALILIAFMVAVWIAYFKAPTNQGNASSNVPITVESQGVTTIPADMVVVPPNASSSSQESLGLPYLLTTSTANKIFWPKAWGDIAFGANSLYLTPDPDTHGANSFLNGASSWSNYQVGANVSNLTSGWFDIVARVSNNAQNFVYCEFGSNGTEVIDRMNGADTQIASSPVTSTPDPQGTAENFGMEVYGNDVACTMAGQEVVGAAVNYSNESSRGGIGFVVFGQPQGQKQIEVSNVSVVALSQNVITVPFPVAVTVSSSTTSTPSVPSSSATSTPATNKLSLPYSIGTFGNSFAGDDGWSDWQGNVTEKKGSLLIGASASSTGGGSLLEGSDAWIDYTFQATLDWNKGETFGMLARYVDDKNYLVCEFDEKNVGDVNIKLDQHLNGVVTHLVSGDILNYDQAGGVNIVAAIQVQGNKGTCAFNGHTVSTVFVSDSISPKLSSGGIGFITWDPKTNNSGITVEKVSASTLIYQLGKNVNPGGK